MKKRILCLSSLTLLALCGFSNNEKVLSAEGGEATIVDFLEFTETGYTAKYKGNPVSIEGIEFDDTSVSYTLTNLNLDFELTDQASKAYFESAGDGSIPEMNFNLVGDNVIKYTGGKEDYLAALTFYSGGKYIFNGEGSLTIDSHLFSYSTESNDNEAAGILNEGILEINEGVTLKSKAGVGHMGSYGIYNSGEIYNKGGSIVATSGTSNPDTFDRNENGTGIGFYNDFLKEGTGTNLLGIYEQSGDTASLTGIGSTYSYRSYGIYSSATGNGSSTFKVTGGTVNAVAEGCYDGDDTASIAMHLSATVQFDIENCMFYLENKSEFINPINTEKGDYLDPFYVAFEADFNNDNCRLGENAYINCKSTAVDRSIIAWFEDPYHDLYCIPEGDEEIFAFDCLESKYPEEATFSKEFNIMEEQKGGSFYEDMANFVLTPQDLTATFVGKEAYYKTCKENAKKAIEDYKKAADYGTDYQGHVDYYQGEIDECSYDLNKTFSENKALVDSYQDPFEEAVAPIVAFVDARNTNETYVDEAVNKDVAVEADLAVEYIGKMNAVVFDATKYQDCITSLNNLKDEFDVKLAELRVVKESFPLWAIIAISGGSLAVIGGVVFILLKKKK